MPTGLIQSLTAQRDKLRTEGKAILTLAETAGGFTDEQRERIDAINAETERIDSDIARQQAADRLLMEAPVVASEPADGGAPRLFGSLGEQLQAVVSAARNPRDTDARLFAINRQALGLSASTGSNETVGFDGGFAVQTDFQPGILDRIYAGSQVAQYCSERQVGAGSNGIAWNVIDETSRVDGSRGGGVQAYWIAEGASITASRPKLARQESNLGKLAALWYATDELLGDAVALESFGDAEFVDELAFKLDDGIVNGTGAGMPQGVLNANALVSVAKETGQAAATVVDTNIKKMWARMSPRSLGNAAWYINQSVWPQIFDLGQAVGVGGNPMFIPAGRISDAPAGTLLGRPIRPIEQAAALGTVGDIIFADMSRYMLIRKGGVQRAMSIHVQFLTDETAFRWILRANGRPMPLAALTPFKGSDTTSPFVALATRS